jgi:metallo-beta-lactamase family protein
VAPGLACTWRPAGHILGAASLLLEAGGRRIAFSGDLGRRARPVVPDPAPPPAADLLVVESTYGDRLHQADEDIPGHLAEAIGGTVARGGKVLIPCFAVERAQELLWHLHGLHEAGRIPAVPVFLDSPMAAKLVEIFRQHPEAAGTRFRARLAQGPSPFAFPGLRTCAGKEDSQRINGLAGPAVVIAGAGMCNGGRIKHHLAHHLHDPESLVLFVGYQANGTLGRQLVEGARRVRLFGREHEVRIRTATVSGFSGHADRDELLAWLAAAEGRPGRIAVVHGGQAIAPAFAALVQERLGVSASAPEYLERIEA